jgi:Na+/phosphate symporter
MIVIVYPLAFAVAGLVIFLLSTKNADAKEIGRIIFFCGLFVLVWILAEGKLKLG